MTSEVILTAALFLCAGPFLLWPWTTFSGRNNAAVVLMFFVYWAAPLVGACYLFTLAVKVP